MSKVFGEIAAGIGLIALDVVTGGATSFLLPTAVSLIAGGVGTLLKKQQTGIASNTINPIQPWNVVYGRTRVGGTTIWQETNGESDKYWHRVIVLACHPCQSVDALLFDNKRVCLDGNGNSISFGNSTSVTASQQTQSISSITRTNNVVTVVMGGPMALPASTAVGPALADGDTVQIENVSIDKTLNGLFQIQVINPTTFTYISGGAQVSGSGGTVKTQWPDYGDTVHLEVALGNQTSNPFPGLASGAPVVIAIGKNGGITVGGGTGSDNWTSNHIVQGMTAVYLRMKYGGNTYQAGIPTIGFLLHGKNDILDPRSGGNGYTENAALCIADYMANQVYGFKCQYGSDLPTDQLGAAANICDETVPLANGASEKRYACNGSFFLSAKRGEILQNLLTSCAGRLTFSGGQYVINPGAWIGTNIQAGYGITNSNGSPATSATVYMTTAHISSGAAQTAAIAQAVNLNPIGLLYPQTFSPWGFAFGSYWGTRTDSMSVPVSALGGLTMGFALDFGNGGVTNDQFLVYDCWVVLTYADGSSGTYRPTSSTINNQNAFNNGTITGGTGIDGNVATIEANPNFFVAGTAVTGFSPVLVLGHFNFPSVGATSESWNWPDFMAGPFEWHPKVPIRDLYNGCKGVYISPLNNWQSTDFPPYAQDTDHGYPSDANLTADGGDRRWLDIQLPFTISYATAQRIAKIELMRRRQQGSGTFVFNLGMYQFTSLDLVSMTMPFLGWTNKLLEVQQSRLTVTKHDEHTMTLGTELDLQETDPSIYSWSTSEELGPAGYAQPQTVGTQTISVPQGVTLGDSAIQGTNVTLAQVAVSWNPSQDGFVANGGSTVVEYSSDNANWISLGTYPSSATTAYIPNISGGTTYYARVAFVNAGGVQSGWTSQGPITATGSAVSFFYADDETPVGAVNGQNQAYSLANVPTPSTSLQLFYNEGLLSPGVDYTISGNVITLTAYTPNGGDYLRAWYRYTTPGVSSGGSTGSSGGSGSTGGTQAWLANTNYSQGTVVTDANGNYETATNAGRSGSVKPAWGTTIGAITSDGTMIWQMTGYGGGSGSGGSSGSGSGSGGSGSGGSGGSGSGGGGTTPLTITTQTLPAGILNVAYSATLSATGGTLPYSWQAAGLPVGLTVFSGSGLISGTPTQNGTYLVSLVATDSASTPAIASAQVILTIQ